MAGAYYHRSVDYVAEVLTGYMTSVPSCVFSNLNSLDSKKIHQIVEINRDCIYKFEVHGNTKSSDSTHHKKIEKLTFLKLPNIEG